jgi:hypothetical protein
VWAIDPGIWDIVTAVDISGRQKKSSLDEYYHLAGLNDAKYKRDRRKKKHMQEYLTISSISSIKTTNEEKFIEACKERLNLYNDNNILWRWPSVGLKHCIYLFYSCQHN